MEQRTTIATMIALVEELRKIDPVMGMQMLATFLAIAQDEGLGVMEVAKRTNQSAASASRNTKMCSPLRKAGKKGYNLIESRYDDYEQRRKVLSLTPTGRTLIKKLTAILNRGS